MNGKLTDRRRFPKLSIVEKNAYQEKNIFQVFRIHGLAMDFDEGKKFQRQTRVTYDAPSPPSSLTRPSTTEASRVKSPDVYLLSEVVDHPLFW